MIILKDLFTNDISYKKFIKTLEFDKMISYPIFIKREYFLSDKIFNLVSNEEDLNIMNYIKGKNIKEIRIDI